jgi:5-methylcytosine-specific restriction endonuclease McrA
MTRQYTEAQRAAERARQQTPERKAAKLAWGQTPEYKAVKRAYRQTSRYKAAKRAYEQTSEAKEKDRARRQRPEAKAAIATRRQKPKAKALSRKATSKRRVLKRALPYIEHDTPMPADGCCPHCRVPMTGKYPASNFPTLDHIIPLDNGGHHVPENTMMICLECNTSKGTRPLEVFLKCPRLAERRAKNKSGMAVDRSSGTRYAAFS